MDGVIQFDDFKKVDVRVGTIISAEIPEGSTKLIKYIVDLGDRKITVFSGIRKWFTPEDLIGTQTTFVVNLAPKKMGDLGESEGMLFAADTEEGPVLVRFNSTLLNGTRLI